MKFIAGICLAFSALALASVQARAADATAGQSSFANASNATDFSARKKRRAATAVQSPMLAAPQLPTWTGADPARGGGISQLRQMQQDGRCVMDEGYGRYTACSNE
jgi:hypothetical protein